MGKDRKQGALLPTPTPYSLLPTPSQKKNDYGSRTPTNSRLGCHPCGKLAGAKGKTFWRTLDEVADTDEFQRVLNDEFPDRANLLASMDRRQFLTLAGASLALAGLVRLSRDAAGETRFRRSRLPKSICPALPCRSQP